MIPPDERFAFDVQGYLHLRAALTPQELQDYGPWMDRVERIDLAALNPDGTHKQMNRPVSRVIDADPRFGRFLDHPATQPYLVTFLGDDYRHIDNELYDTYPGYPGGEWHRGAAPHPTGHVVDGRFICPMVKVFYCMSDVGPGGGEFVVVPGSHRAMFEIETKDRIDLPAQHIFDDVRTGDVIIFNEALLHNGRPNLSPVTRKTIIMNFGRSWAGVWENYQPAPATRDAVTPNQRRILSNTQRTWQQIDVPAELTAMTR